MTETVDAEVIEKPGRKGRNFLIIFFLFLALLITWEVAVREPALRWLGWPLKEVRSGSSGTAPARITEDREGDSDSALMGVEESDIKSIAPEERAVLGMKYRLLEERANAARDQARQMLRELRRIEREEERRRRAERALK